MNGPMNASGASQKKRGLDIPEIYSRFNKYHVIYDKFDSLLIFNK